MSSVPQVLQNRPKIGTNARQQVDAYASNVQGLEPSKYLPLGQYKFNKVSV